MYFQTNRQVFLINFRAKTKRWFKCHGAPLVSLKSLYKLEWRYFHVSADGNVKLL